MCLCEEKNKQTIVCVCLGDINKDVMRAGMMEPESAQETHNHKRHKQEIRKYFKVLDGIDYFKQFTHT